MTTLVLGASGATGKHLVEELLRLGKKVKILVRESSVFPEHWIENSCVTLIKANINEISADDMSVIIKDCQDIACCLGHNLTLKGIYGKPRKLVYDAVKLICEAIDINSNAEQVKFILMNTAGNQNRDLDEPISFGEKLLVSLIRLLLPPHIDNENAADYLRVNIGHENPKINWVVVRPDSLIDSKKVTQYNIHISPTRSAIFNPGKTSRINVGHFMASLIDDNTLWLEWMNKMPVLYNKEKGYRK